MSKQDKKRLSGEQVDELIDLVEERDIIWNVKLKTYYNKENVSLFIRR